MTVKMDKQLLFESMLMNHVDQYVQRVLQIAIEEMFTVHEDAFTMVFVVNTQVHVEREYDMVQFHYVDDDQTIECVKLRFDEFEDLKLVSTQDIDLDRFLEL